VLKLAQKVVKEGNQIRQGKFETREKTQSSELLITAFVRGGRISCFDRLERIKGRRNFSRRKRGGGNVRTTKRDEYEMLTEGRGRRLGINPSRLKA